jgi:hypothetical protein
MTETAVETSTLATGDLAKVKEYPKDAAGNEIGDRLTGQTVRLDFLDSYSGWFVRPVNGEIGGYVGPQYLNKIRSMDGTYLPATDAAAEEAAKLREENNRLTLAVNELTAKSESFERALSAFKEATRNALVSKAESADQDYEAEVFDNLLDTLDLPEREREFELRVRFDGSFYVTVTATSLDSAISQAEKFQFVRDYFDNNPEGSWLDTVEAEDGD